MPSNSEIHRLTAIQQSQEIQQLHEKRDALSLDLLAYFGNYEESTKLSDAGLFQPPKTASTDSILYSTSDDYEKLRIGSVELERSGESTILITATARYKPENEDDYETDRWGYTETKPIEAFRLTDLSELESDLIESFIPVAVKEAGGFAGFRETATKTNSLVDRLKMIKLPALDDVRDGFESYLEAKERAKELEDKIECADEMIDEIVYALYGLSEEEIRVVEEAVSKD